MIDTLIGLLKIILGIGGTVLAFYIIAKIGVWYEDRQNKK